MERGDALQVQSDLRAEEPVDKSDLRAEEPVSDLREEVEQNNFLQQKPKELSNLIQEEIEEPAQENKEEGRAESVEKKNLNNPIQENNNNNLQEPVEAPEDGKAEEHKQSSIPLLPPPPAPVKIDPRDLEVVLHEISFRPPWPIVTIPINPMEGFEYKTRLKDFTSDQVVSLEDVACDEECEVLLGNANNLEYDSSEGEIDEMRKVRKPASHSRISSTDSYFDALDVAEEGSLLQPQTDELPHRPSFYRNSKCPGSLLRTTSVSTGFVSVYDDQVSIPMLLDTSQYARALALAGAEAPEKDESYRNNSPLIEKTAELAKMLRELDEMALAAAESPKKDETYLNNEPLIENTAELPKMQHALDEMKKEKKQAERTQLALDKATEENVALKVENARLSLALEELSKRFEDMKQMMAAKGVDSSILEWNG